MKLCLGLVFEAAWCVQDGADAGCCVPPPRTCWVATHLPVALVSFAMQFGLRVPVARQAQGQQPSCRRETGSCSGAPFQGWNIPSLSIPPWLSNPGDSGGRRFTPTSCSLRLGLAGSLLPPVLSAPAHLQSGAEPSNTGVNKQACPFVRGGQGVFQGEMIQLSVPAGARQGWLIGTV